MKKIISLLLSRPFLILLLIIVQFIFVFSVMISIGISFRELYSYLFIFSGFVILILLNRNEVNPTYKLLWITLIAFMPFFGIVIYYLLGQRSSNSALAKKMDYCIKRSEEALDVDYKLFYKLYKRNKSNFRTSAYLNNYAKAPLYDKVPYHYFAWGEEFFKKLIEELETAEKFIFMEFFIIDIGFMFDSIFEILKRKVDEGVDVRIIYDSYGSLLKMPKKEIDLLREHGIKCEEFTPLTFSLRPSDYLMLNHRSHRKLVIIDGYKGFTGGLNLADEYINHIERFGVWKDTGFMIEGHCVYPMTASFLSMWDFVTSSESNIEKFKSRKSKVEGTETVQTYFDSPLDWEAVSKNVYMNIIQQAEKYVYITTPYLILDEELITCLQLASKSGIEIKIITPGIPDKWYAFWLTQSYYKTLMEAGVEIYEYTPGFIHSKMAVSDDKIALIGTANLDYRSLYLHFENGTVFYNGNVPLDVKEDFLNTLADSKKISMQDIKETPIYKRIYQAIMKVFSPLM